MPDAPLLAIVVPAYKARYLGEALRSIAAQTDQRFQLYVCDDGSPENLEPIFHAAGLPATAVFHRFEQNVGRTSLIESWRRAVDRSTEPWVWLFSDDDLMDPGCVAAFYHALSQDGDTINVYRFNTLVMDGAGQIIRIHPPNPERESVEEFIYHRLTEQRFGTAPEHIFRRSAYETRGGFVDLPFGLGSDDATWINLAGSDTPLRGIAGPRVCWRLSGINVSSFSTDYVVKHLGFLAYSDWLCRRLGGDSLRTVDGHPTVFDLRALVHRWFLSHFRRSRHFFSPGEVGLVAREAFKTLGISERHVWLVLIRSNFYFLLHAVKRLLKLPAV